MEAIKDIVHKFLQLMMIALAVLLLGLQFYQYTSGPSSKSQSEKSSTSGVVTVNGQPQATPAVQPSDAAPQAIDVAATGSLAAPSTDMPAESIAEPAKSAVAVPAPTSTDQAPATGDWRRAAAESPAAKPEPLANQEIRAQLSPRQYTTLATEIGARIRRMPVAESGPFRRGQLLVAFDCSIQKAQLDRSRADMVAASKTLSANEQLDKFNSIGKIELDTSFSALQKAKADVAIAQASLAKCEIRAPFDGRVVEAKVREQQYVQPGQPLMEILDDSSLELEFIVPSRWLGWLKPGLPFTVTIDETGRAYGATFTRIGAKVDPASMTVKVAGQIEGQHRELMAGMSGVIEARQPEQPGSEKPRPASQQRRPGVRAERTSAEM